MSKCVRYKGGRYFEFVSILFATTGLKNVVRYTGVFIIKGFVVSVFLCIRGISLSRGYQNSKRKLGVATHYSKIIELKFGKKLLYILCTLTLFRVIAA